MENRKVFMNKQTNLLELEEHMYPLVDVKTPNVFRNLFHYVMRFLKRLHLMIVLSLIICPEEIWITDTTFRDGQQSRVFIQQNRL